ncbi:DDE_3 domain-containing protein [Trichonephila clavipes]|nr:DDE_3 domain-containing protein [Trichonephila clavipes]
MGAVGPDFILMNDNARSHRAHLVDKFLERDDIHRIDLPVRSPNLIRIEYVWDALGRAIGTHIIPLRTIQCLRKELLNNIRVEFERETLESGSSKRISKKESSKWVRGQKIVQLPDQVGYSIILTI